MTTPPKKKQKKPPNRNLESKESQRIPSKPIAHHYSFIYSNATGRKSTLTNKEIKEEEEKITEDISENRTHT